MTLKPVLAFAGLVTYSLYRLSQYNDHEKRYKATHQETINKINQIRKDSLKNHEETQKRLQEIKDSCGHFY